MDSAKQKALVHDFLNTIRNRFDTLQAAGQIPDWNGSELRAWVSEEAKRRTALDRRRLVGKRGSQFKSKVMEIQSYE